MHLCIDIGENMLRKTLEGGGNNLNAIQFTKKLEDVPQGSAAGAEISQRPLWVMVNFFQSVNGYCSRGTRTCYRHSCSRLW